MTQVVEQVQPDLTDGDDEWEPQHLVCCSGDWAMCGLYVPDETCEWTDLPDSEDCVMCVYVSDHGLPCPVPGCPAGAA